MKKLFLAFLLMIAPACREIKWDEGEKRSDWEQKPALSTTLFVTNVIPNMVADTVVGTTTGFIAVVISPIHGDGDLALLGFLSLLTSPLAGPLAGIIDSHEGRFFWEGSMVRSTVFWNSPLYYWG